ncbi:phosphate acyltransferase [Brucella abortus]|nr:phosphate acyltransferase [Brucella abortus]
MAVLPPARSAASVSNQRPRSYRIQISAQRNRQARKMRQAAAILAEKAPDLESDGEMHGDAALSQTLRDRVFPSSRLKGEANLLVFPNLDAANITLNVVKAVTDALHVGPILPWSNPSGPYSDAFRHIARCRQHDGAGRRRKPCKKNASNRRQK